MLHAKFQNTEIFQVNFSLLSILTIFSIICLFPITRPKVQRSTLKDETSMERKDSVHSRTGTTDVDFLCNIYISLIYIEKDEGWFEEGT